MKCKVWVHFVVSFHSSVFVLLSENLSSVFPGLLFRITEPEKCDANGIYQAISEKCREMKLELDNSMVAVAADGASVNFGRIGGVLTKLRDSYAPWLIKIHCIAHRLELSLKDAFKGSYFTEVCHCQPSI